MNNKTPKHTGRSFPILMLFCTIVGLLVLISFVVKIAAVVAKSGFDGRHRFTLLVVDKPIRVISFAPDASTISLLTIPSAATKTKSGIANLLHIPIDGVVTEKTPKTYTDSSDAKDIVESYTQNLFFTYVQKNTDITVVDAFRIWLFARDTQSHNVYDDALTDTLEKTEEATLNNISERLFWDTTIAKENIGIQIINGTDVSGIGNDFAQTISNIGGNVAAVSTAHADIQKTTITYADAAKSYTAQKLEKMLGVKAMHVQKQTTFGIIVTIGKDTISRIQGE